MNCLAKNMSIYNYIERCLFQPPRPLLAFPSDGVPMNQVCLDIYESTKIPCTVYLHSNPRFTIIYNHGNNENLLSMQWYLKDLSTVLEADVYAFEYKGYYTDSAGVRDVPSEQACFDSAERFANCVKKVSTLPVILLGYSMGSAVALHAAEVHKEQDFPHAVILIAPFISAASTLLARRPLAIPFSFLWEYVDVFPMRSAALKQGHNIVVAHGGADDVIPLCHGRSIYEWASQHSKHHKFLEIEEATHADIRLFRDLYTDIEKFLENV